MKLQTQYNLNYNLCRNRQANSKMCMEIPRVNNSSCVPGERFGLSETTNNTCQLSKDRDGPSIHTLLARMIIEIDPT